MGPWPHGTPSNQESSSAPRTFDPRTPVVRIYPAGSQLGALCPLAPPPPQMALRLGAVAGLRPSPRLPPRSDCDRPDLEAQRPPLGRDLLRWRPRNLGRVQCRYVDHRDGRLCTLGPCGGPWSLQDLLRLGHRHCGRSHLGRADRSTSPRETTAQLDLRSRQIGRCTLGPLLTASAMAH